MEKLIELLNEYETPRSGVVYKSYDSYDGFFYGVDCDGETEIVWSDSLICSKKFGFIERLYNKNKVKRDCLVQYDIKSAEIGGVEVARGAASQGVSLLMLLSIQEKPGEFLISILK